MRSPTSLRLLPATLLAALSLTVPAAIAGAATPAMSPALTEVLEGRTAGKPVDCISLPRIRSSTIVDRTAVIYKESRRRWYVNVPDNGACPLAPQRATIVRVPGTRLCSGDLISVVDFPQHFGFGSCALGRFVPYTK